MMHCPFCRNSAHSRTSRYLSDSVKHRYYQCQNVLCSATFRSMESVESIIRQPVAGDEPAENLSRVKWIKHRNSDRQQHNDQPGMNP